MNTARYWAQALYELVSLHPERGAEYLQNLRSALARHGHGKLLPRIYAEFQKLQTAASRAQRYRSTTPHMERTRVLLELYRTLIAVK